MTTGTRPLPIPYTSRVTEDRIPSRLGVGLTEDLRSPDDKRRCVSLDVRSVLGIGTPRHPAQEIVESETDSDP